MKYQYKQEDLFTFVQSMGFETKQKGKELMFKRCPYCNSGDHKEDFWKFSVNTETGVYNCFRASCGEKGHFIKLAHDFNYQLYDENAVSYKVYDGFTAYPDGWTATPEAVHYLGTRGIKKEVVEHCHITTAYDNPNIMLFPFFDETSKLQTTKKRNTAFRKGIDRSKEWFEKDTKPILYGMWIWHDFTKPLIITEGQIDALSLMSAGIENAVSVPNGAKAFTWVRYCRTWVEKFPEIIVFGDYENGKMTLVDELDKEFPTIPLKAVKRANYMSCKDANEILTTQAIGNDFTSGYKILKAAVEHTEDVRKLPILTADQIDWTDFTPPKVIKTGFPTLDEAIRGFVVGSFNVLSGASGIGKSNFTLQLLVNAMFAEKKVLVYSGEIPNKKIIQQLAFIILGKDRLTDKVDINSGDSYPLPEEGMSEIVNRWFKGRLFLWNDERIDKDETDEEKKSKFLRNLQRIVTTNQIDMVVVDNLMTLTAYSSDKDLYNQQSAFCTKLTDMAQECKTVILLVAHPRKYAGINGSAKYDEISGSMNIVNLASLVLFYTRIEDEDKDPDKAYSNRMIVVSKNRENGIVLEGKKGIRTMFSPVSRRIFEAVRENDGKITHDKQKIHDAQIDYLAEYPPTAQMLKEIEAPW